MTDLFLLFFVAGLTGLVMLADYRQQQPPRRREPRQRPRTRQPLYRPARAREEHEQWRG
jgi:hypothetical protein